MKNLIILLNIIFYFLFYTGTAYSQAPCPCPERFIVSDSTCTNIFAVRSGNGYSASDSIHACKGSTITYTINSTTNGCSYPGIVYTYTVTNGTLVSSSGSQFTITWGTSSPAAVTINFLYNVGPGQLCAGSFTVFALLTNKPVAAFTISPNPACFNNPTTINFNSNASLNAVNYFWDFGDGFYGSGPNPTHNYTLPGTYVITLIVSSPTSSGGGGTSPIQVPCPSCTDSIKHTLLINNLPGPPIECVASVCAGEEASYCTTPLACATYVWTITGGTITSGQGTPCIQVQWGSGNPQGTITLVITGCPNYCAQGTTVNVPIIPATTTISGPTPVCVGSNANYSLPAFPGATYSWTLSGGGTITGNNTNTAQINVNWTTIGTFIITCNYYDSSKGCGGIGTLSVTVLPTASIHGNNTFCAGSSTTLISKDQFNNPVPSIWSVSPAGTSFTGGNTGSSVTITSNTPGVYFVTASPNAGSACNVPTYTITVLPQPVLNPIQGADSICAGQTYVYAVSSNTVGPFAWVISNGTAVYLSANNDSAQITWGAGGPYTISITQTSNAGCVSNPQVLSVFPYPTPVLNGPTNVCADAVVSYTVTNMGSHPFNWSVSPASFGTILSGQGTNTISIKWHGSIIPGSHTVYLRISFCKDDSIAVTINQPVLPVITASGSLCGGGVSLNPAATGGPYSWTCVENSYTSSSAIATGITLPGHYNVTIANYNNSGCSVTATYFVPDLGRPIANISANNVLNYCLPNLPNLNLVAAAGAGYSYQWYQSPATPVGANSPVYPVNSLTTAGSYTYYCVVTLNSCSVTSNSITINISNCTGNPGGPGCTGILDITNIAGCNPFTLALAAAPPVGGTIVGGTTTISYPNALPTSGNTTMTYDSVGYKQITVCADIALPGGGTTRCCKDTVVLVTVAAKFLANNNCGIITLTDLSTVVSPNTISSYNWGVGAFPGNTPVALAVASFNNISIANPILTVNVSGQYIITLQITSGPCTVSYMDTILVSVPNAAFTVSNSCVGTPVNLTGAVYQSYLWNFGDAATSYTQNTSHAYASSGIFTITHTVTDANGCTNTATQPITIIPKPTCNISYSGPTTFCAGNNIVLNACAGFSSYQWYNNGNIIITATSQIFTAIQTGNYSFTALNANSCVVNSDTVSITVTPAPPAVISVSGSYCVGGVFNIGVQGCNTCTFVWTDNNVIMPAFTSNQGSFPVTVPMVGTHTFAVTVTDSNTGCSATSNVTVTFNNIPTVSISPAPNNPVLCSGNLYVLTATSNAASPVWAWNWNAGNIVLSVLNTINASAAGTYTVIVKDGITGCSASASQVVDPSPDLSLFPSGCDTLCDTAHVLLPLGSINGNIANYTITWYNNAPPYTSIIGSGPVLNLNTLPLGNNSISVIVVNIITGCADTSNNYNIYIRHCAGCNCQGATWDSLYWHHAAPLPPDNGLMRKDSSANVSNVIIIPPVDTSFTCGQNLGTINCNNPISIFAKFKCNPSSCDSAVKYILTGPVTMTGIMPFNTSGLPAGNYVLILTGKCGDSVCKVCDVPFKIACDTAHVDCCTNSHWASGPFWVNKAANINSTIACNSSSFLINTINKNCFTPTVVKGTYACAIGCTSGVTYELRDSATNNLITSAVDSLVIAGALPSGSYYVMIKAFCGGILCDSCKFKFSKQCACECDSLKGIQFQLTTNEVVKKYNCGSKLPLISCTDNVVLSGLYTCKPTTCPSSFTYQLTGPFGNTTGTLPLALNTLTQGTYTITLFAYCNGLMCKNCTFSFTVKCDGVPPPPCCPYNIGISTNNSTYSQTPTGNATIINSQFTISGLAGVPLSEVRAEVLSYTIGSNYNNECLGCYTLPFTWASTSTASNIGTVSPLITMYGSTTTNFVPTGPLVYQNPREVVWGSSSLFNITAPVSIGFLLPPPPVIECCELSGRICVKFTFKDSKCKVCEVITCFDFFISNGNIFKFCNKIAKGD